MTSQTIPANDQNNRVVEAFNDKLLDLFNLVVVNKKTYYQANPDKRPVKAEIGRLIENCAKTNAAITAALNLIPGPFGLLAIVPELVLVTKNQLDLIYDISVAINVDKKMTPELLAMVFASTFGMSLGAFGVMHGGKLVVKRSSLRVMQKVVAVIGGKITQQALKASIGKWLPFVGSAALGLWSYKTTKSIGQGAIKAFETDIEIID